MTEPADSLNLLRQKIDALDEQILALLRERMDCVEEVGALKHAQKDQGNFIRPGREAAMLRRLLAQADPRYPAEAITTIWRLLIAASLKLEQSLTLVLPKPLLPAHAEEFILPFYGSFLARKEAHSAKAALQLCAEKPHHIALFPFPAPGPAPAWCHALAASPLHAFAALPFGSPTPHATPTLLAVGMVEPCRAPDHVELILENHTIMIRPADALIPKDGLLLGSYAPPFPFPHSE